MGRKVVVELSDISSFSISEECKVKSCSNDSCPNGCKRYVLVSRPGKPIWHVQTKEMRNTITQSAANKQPKAAKKQPKVDKAVKKPAAASSSSSSSESSVKAVKKAPKQDKIEKKINKLEEVNVDKKASAYPWADVQKQKQKDGQIAEKKAEKKVDKKGDKKVEKKGDKKNKK